MRVLAIATLLLASSLVPSFAEDEVKAPPFQQKTAPAQADQPVQQPRVEEKNRAEDSKIGRDWRMGHDSDVEPDRDMSRNRGAYSNRELDRERKMNRDWMGRDHEMGRDREMIDRDRGPMRRERDGREMGRDWRTDSDRDGRIPEGRESDRDRYGYNDRHDDGRARRRIKICVEYESGDEYCRYR